MSRYLDLSCPLELDHPLNQGLVACWLALPGRQGFTLHDVSPGQAYPLAASSSAPAWCGGPNPDVPEVGASRHVRASAQEFFIAEAAVAAVPVTLATWGRSANAADSQYPIAVRQNTAASGLFGLNWAGATGGDPIRAVVGGGGNFSIATAGGYTANRWCHGAAVFATNSSRTAYLNGVGGSAETTSRTPASLSDTVVGGDRVASFFDGDIADPRVYNRALSDREIYGLYEEGLKGWPNLLRWCTGRVTVAMPAAAPSTFTATAALAAPAATLSASAQFTGPVYEATAALTAGVATLAASATHTPPVYTAAADLATAPAALAGSAQHTTPTYTASATLQTAPAELAASATHTTPSYTASADLTAAPATLAASAAYSSSVSLGVAALASAPASLAGSATFAPGTKTATAALATPPATLAASAAFTPPTRTATAAFSAAPAVLNGAAAYSPPGGTPARRTLTLPGRDRSRVTLPGTDGSRLTLPGYDRSRVTLPGGTS